MTPSETPARATVKLNARVSRVIHDEDRDYPIVLLYLYDCDALMDVPWPDAIVPAPRDSYTILIHPTK